MTENGPISAISRAPDDSRTSSTALRHILHVEHVHEYTKVFLRCEIDADKLREKTASWTRVVPSNDFDTRPALVLRTRHGGERVLRDDVTLVSPAVLVFDCNLGSDRAKLTLNRALVEIRQFAPRALPPLHCQRNYMLNLDLRDRAPDLRAVRELALAKALVLDANPDPPDSVAFIVPGIGHFTVSKEGKVLVDGMRTERAIRNALVRINDFFEGL